MKILVLRSLCVGVLCAALCACASSTPAPKKQPTPAEIRQATLQALQADQVKVFQMGDDVRIVIPSQTLFGATATDLKDQQSMDVLNLVIKLIQDQPILRIQVTAFTYPRHTAKEDQAFTTKQAKRVVRYLIQKGFHTRFIYAEGAGSAYPVTQSKDNAANYRVEITLKELKSEPKVNLIDY